MPDKKLQGALSSRSKSTAARMATMALLALAGSAAACWSSGTIGPRSSLLLVLTVPMLKQD